MQLGYTGEAKWCPKAEASSRGDAKQPRRRAGARAPDEISGSRPREYRAFAFEFRGVVFRRRLA
jgi:hypothetical protein